MKKTYLVLGGFGFIGTNILKFIDDNNLNIEIIVFDRFDKHPRGITFNCVKSVYSGDFSDTELINKIFSENKIDKVIHSLNSTVPISLTNRRYDIESNLINTVELLQTMIRHKVYDIVYISSGGAIYGVNTTCRHKEDEVAYPISSYGIVKLTIEKYLFQMAYVDGLRPLIIRLSNPYGKYHYSNTQGICNIAIRNSIHDKIFQVRGDGRALKDYIFINDFCAILFLLLHHNIHSEIINVASGIIKSVNQILHYVRQNFKSTFKWNYIKESACDVQHFELDTTKLEGFIGKFEYTPFDVGMKITCEWENEVLTNER